MTPPPPGRARRVLGWTAAAVLFALAAWGIVYSVIAWHLPHG